MQRESVFRAVGHAVLECLWEAAPTLQDSVLQAPCMLPLPLMPSVSVAYPRCHTHTAMQRKVEVEAAPLFTAQRRSGSHLGLVAAGLVHHFLLLS